MTCFGWDSLRENILSLIEPTKMASSFGRAFKLGKTMSTYNALSGIVKTYFPSDKALPVVFFAKKQLLFVKDDSIARISSITQKSHWNACMKKSIAPTHFMTSVNWVKMPWEFRSGLWWPVKKNLVKSAKHKGFQDYLENTPRDEENRHLTHRAIAPAMHPLR